MTRHTVKPRGTLAGVLGALALAGCPAKPAPGEGGPSGPPTPPAQGVVSGPGSAAGRDATAAASTGAAAGSAVVAAPIAAPGLSDGGAQQSPRGALRGLYSRVRDKAIFTECGSPGRVYEVQDAADTLGKRARELIQYGGEALYIEVGGTLERMARTSAGLEIEGNLALKDIYRVERKSPAVACIRHDYWLFGSRPAWSVQISEAEGLIDFHHDGLHNSWHFDFVRPKTTGSGASRAAEWNVSNPVWKTALKVRVFDAQCTDGSAKIYGQRATVTLDKVVYQGCAADWK